ncbi:MAG: IreB family regulatory phosphoprotein [Clostridia bacterium]|nr:IreB family regulatory phosphoprotein [Clostridia bacterium]
MDKTMVFSLNDKDEILRKNLTIVYDALKEKGYNPINQIVGYILSEDPTYVTTHNNARAIISRMEREDILETLLKSFLNKK